MKNIIIEQPKTMEKTFINKNSNVPKLEEKKC
jgi:hypothetical protein